MQRGFQLGKFKKSIILAGFFVLLCFWASETVRVNAEETKRTTKTLKGINFNIPADWPLEERGGALGPIPVEEYLIMKFGKTGEHFKQLETQVSGGFEDHSAGLRLLESKVEDIDKRLKDLETWLKRGQARRLD